ncbi:hypothetical protein E2C01_038457 [Portunus trituberculatus]|uniref:Uncharacterized protein n=1 Tax=Portunus trituberculatus TaxID=210409 RepID=A0A5B7FGV7_PORTR|nr:hypothetical protein [Portunus trituberculatus]
MFTVDSIQSPQILFRSVGARHRPCNVSRCPALNYNKHRRRQLTCLLQDFPAPSRREGHFERSAAQLQDMMLRDSSLKIFQ